MSEIRITYNPTNIKQVTDLNGLKGKNLVANEIFANEDWLDADADGDNPTDHKISGTEFLNFAKHIDTNENNEITDAEIEKWRQNNVSVGNTAHNSFSDEEVMELFDLVITQANEQTGKKNSGTIYPDSGSSRNANQGDFFDSGEGVSHRYSLAAQNYDKWAGSVDTERVAGLYDTENTPTVTFSTPTTQSRATQDTEATYDTDALKTMSTNKVNDSIKNLKGTNLVVQNIYAHEEWLDEDEHDGKATNKNVDNKISGAELANFARHIDSNHDGKITESEFNTWRSDNISVGNSAHANFTYEQVQEIFKSVK